MDQSECWTSFPVEENNTTPFFNSSQSESEIYPCFICGLQYISLKFLKLHINTTHDHNQPIISSYGTEIHNNFVIETTNTNRVPNEFSDEIGLPSNDVTPLLPPAYPTEERYQCDQCPGTFASKYYLPVHCRRAHSDQNPHYCYTCLKSFPTETSCPDHVKLISDIDKEYESAMKEWRDVERQRKSAATQALQLEAYKPFVCDKCGMRFKKQHYLDVHQKTDHGVEMNFECDVCHTRFPARWELTRHLKTKNKNLSLTCKFCPDQGFCSTKTWKAHIRDHEGVEPQVCEHCSKDFVNKYALRNHVWRNQLQNPKPCFNCAKSFLHRCGLAAHTMQEHAKINNSMQQ